VHERVDDCFPDGFEGILDLVHAPTAIADDGAHSEVAAEHEQGGLDHLGEGTSYRLVVEESRTGGVLRGMHDHRDHQLGEELLRELPVGEESGERQGRTRRGFCCDPEPVQNSRVVGLREFREPGAYLPQGASHCLVVQVVRGGSLDGFTVVQRLDPRGHDHRDLRLGHATVTVAPAQVRACRKALRGDIGRTLVRRHGRYLRHHQPVALDFDDLSADPERRRDVVPGHLDQTVPKCDGIVQLDEAEPAAFIDAEQDRSAVGVRERAEGLADRPGKAPGSTAQFFFEFFDQ
jgi:hypothetical protein